MEGNWGYVLWAVIAFIASAVLSLIVVTIVLVSLPRRYFLDRASWQPGANQHPAVRLALQVLKNLLGLCLVAAGLLLSLPGIPGQGILTIVIGILLVDFPGKRRWERKLVSRPRILAAINRIRRTFGRSPLQLAE
jgi:hypothetical protein